MILKIKVKANTSFSKIGKIIGSYLVVYTKSPREKGLANKELISILSKNFMIPKSSISIKTGNTSILKNILIEDSYAGLVFDKLSKFS